MASQPSPSPIFTTLSQALSSSSDAYFWWHTAGRDLAAMLASAAWPELSQHRFLTYFRDSLCPHLGPAPTPSSIRSVTWDGSPFEYSFEFRGSTRQPAVRFVVDLSRLNQQNAEAELLDTSVTQALVTQLVDANAEADRMWYDALSSSLATPTSSVDEAKTLVAKAGHRSPQVLGFDVRRDVPDLVSTEAEVTARIPVLGKIYFLPCLAAAQRRTSRWAVVADAIHNLPSLDPDYNVFRALNMIESYLATKPASWKDGVRYLATDLVVPEKARLKIYLRCPGAEFEEMWDLLTLGGKIQGLEGQKKAYEDLVEMLTDNRGPLKNKTFLDAETGKPEVKEGAAVATGAQQKRTTVYFSLSKDRPFPVPKLCVCPKNFADDDAVVARGLDEWLAKYGWSEETGEYQRMVERVFTHRKLEEKSGIHSFIGIGNKKIGNATGNSDAAQASKDTLSMQVYYVPELYSHPRDIQ